MIEDATRDYSNKPVDEILVSPAFDHTLPYSAEISALLARHDAAIRAGDEAERSKIEAELQQRNRQRFAYFEIDEMLRKAAGEAP